MLGTGGHIYLDFRPCDAVRYIVGVLLYVLSLLGQLAVT